jgi:hypothetical protein
MNKVAERLRLTPWNSIVIDKHTNKELTRSEILDEVNRDRSEAWTDYTLEDLVLAPEEVLFWIDETYYDMRVIQFLEGKYQWQKL